MIRPLIPEDLPTLQAILDDPAVAHGAGLGYGRIPSAEELSTCGAVFMVLDGGDAKGAFVLTPLNGVGQDWEIHTLLAPDLAPADKHTAADEILAIAFFELRATRLWTRIDPALRHVRLFAMRHGFRPGPIASLFQMSAFDWAFRSHRLEVKGQAWGDNLGLSASAFSAPLLGLIVLLGEMGYPEAGISAYNTMGALMGLPLVKLVALQCHAAEVQLGEATFMLHKEVTCLPPQ